MDIEFELPWVRGTEEFPYEKGSKKRILVLGDSFTFGEGVSDHETCSHVLATLLPGTEVLNFGVHGYGHDQMLLYFIDEAVKYKPDIVVLGFISIDMERNIVGFRDYAKRRFVVRGGELVLTQVPVPSPEEILRAESRCLRTWDFLKVVGSLFCRWIALLLASGFCGPGERDIDHRSLRRAHTER